MLRRLLGQGHFPIFDWHNASHISLHLLVPRPNGKSWSVFDDRVGWFSPIVYILVIFADGARAKRSEEQNSKRGVLQLADVGRGLSLSGSLQ